jgi:hypothetical protein
VAFAAWQLRCSFRRRLAVLAERLIKSLALRRLRGGFHAWAGLVLRARQADARVSGESLGLPCIKPLPLRQMPS